jgi:hypothetical protein
MKYANILTRHFHYALISWSQNVTQIKFVVTTSLPNYHLMCSDPALRCLSKGKGVLNLLQEEIRKFSKIQVFWGVAPCFLKPKPKDTASHPKRHGSSVTALSEPPDLQKIFSGHKVKISIFCWVNSSHVISSCSLLHNMGINCILYQELTKKTAVT